MAPARATDGGSTRHPRRLLVAYGLVWAALAIDPVHRGDWLLENLLVAVALPLLVLAARRVRIEALAWNALFAFFVLHAVGAHYTYSEVPYERWFAAAGLGSPGAAFGWQRNHYDRFVHFAFGLCVVPIARALFDSVAPARGFWRAALPVTLVMAFSALYELIEWLAALVFGGDLGVAYLGTQGDAWDAQRDMALAAGGALAATAALLVRRPGAAGSQPARTALVLVFVAAAVLAAGCTAQPTHGEPLTGRSGAGYRYDGHAAGHRGDDLLLVMTFSGGGTRASALAFGVLEQLAADHVEHDGARRRLLDEVDVISSVSGGSVTAAYYVLHGDALFDHFRHAFLHRPVETEVWRAALLSPRNWLRLGSRTYARGDLFADYLDRHLYRGATFADLQDPRRPFLVVNATDLSAAGRFEFTQDWFDVLCVDLLRYPVARAVAASSAYPVILTPLALRNRAGACEYAAPPWLARALRPETGGRRHALAERLAAYREPGRLPFLHLADGALSDNLGLRPIIDVLVAAGDLREAQAALGLSGIRRAVVITVNAAGAGGERIARSATPPRVGDTATLAGGALIDLYAAENRALLRDVLHRLAADVADAPSGEAGRLETYWIDVELAGVEDAARRERLRAVPTDFGISPALADELACTARALLAAAPDYARLLADLGSRTGPVAARCP